MVARSVRQLSARWDERTAVFAKWMSSTRRAATTRTWRRCPPLYPPQYADRRFFDQPTAGWPRPNALFEARAFLSQADYEARQLTIYDGVNYGFALDAEPIPEPATVLLTLGGLLGIRARRRTSGRASLKRQPQGTLAVSGQLS
jgi:hypothetical protein